MIYPNSSAAAVILKNLSFYRFINSLEPIVTESLILCNPTNLTREPLNLKLFSPRNRHLLVLSPHLTEILCLTKLEFPAPAPVVQ